MADQASGNNEVHIQLDQRTDAKILQAIEEALKRIGAYLRRSPRLRHRSDRRGTASRDPWTRVCIKLQGKTEFVTDLLPLLQDFYRDKLAELLRHEAGARLVGQCDANNTLSTHHRPRGRRSSPGSATPF